MVPAPVVLMFTCEKITAGVMFVVVAEVMWVALLIMLAIDYLCLKRPTLRSRRMTIGQ